MSVSDLIAPGEMSVFKRSALFVLAAAVGTLVAIAWNPKGVPSAAYFGFLRIFLDPRAQIVGLAAAVVLAFLVGAIHVVHMCYLPAALSAMPLVRGHKGKGEWLKTAAVLALSMAAVTGLWGAIIAIAGGSVADFFRQSRNMALILKPTLSAMGFVMLVIALGEFGLVRRLLPDIHPAVSAGPGPHDRTTGGRYRQAALRGVIIAATFGVICTLPPYLALLLYVAVIGSVWYGVLALSAYGVGLALPIVLGGFALLPADRSARLTGWLASRQEAFHNVQGILFAFLGGLLGWYFGIKYVIPPVPHP